MKTFHLAVTSAMVCCAFAASSNAQQIETPQSVRPIDYTYDYYDVNQPEAPPEASPSDVAPPTDKSVKQACGAGNSCDSCGGCDGSKGCGCNSCCCTRSCFLFGPDEAWSIGQIGCCGPTVGGWVSTGYHSELEPFSFTRGDVLSFGDVSDQFILNQAWLYAERAADGGDCCWDWGYRVDAFYGSEGHGAQAYGNPPIAAGAPAQRNWDNTWDHGVYEWAIPQAYISLARGDLSIKAGHFFTPVGYEVINSTGNFFYTHALTHYNAEPFTHTGVLANYSVSDNLQVYGGWALGWDTGFDQFGNGNIVMSGMTWALTDNIKFTYGSTGGNFGLRGTQAYSQHMFFDFTLTEKLQYILYSDWVSIGAGNPSGVATGVFNDQLSILNYLFYTVNDCLKIGGRTEWFKNDGISYNAITGGLNYKPHANITLRPEMRYDWTPTSGAAPGRTYPAGVNNVTSFSMDVIFTF